LYFFGPFCAIPFASKGDSESRFALTASPKNHGFFALLSRL
jgi:hypothetical protein